MSEILHPIERASEPLAQRENVAATIIDPFADELAPSRQVREQKAPITPAAFLRQKWLILGVAGVTAAVGLAAIWTVITPKYRAKATIEVLPAPPRVLYKNEDTGLLPYHQQFLNSQAGVVRGVNVLKAVLEDPAVQATQWYKQPKRTWLGRTESQLGALRDAVEAEARPGTYLLDISMVAANHADAETIVNAVVDQYLNFAQLRSAETRDAVYQRLQAMKEQLEKQIQARKAVTKELQKDLGTAVPEEAISREKARIEDWQTRLEDLRRDIAAKEWEEQELEKLLARPDEEKKPDVDAEDDVRPRYRDDAEWRKLALEIKTLKHQLQSPQLGRKAPQRLELERQLAFREELLKEQEDLLDDQWQRYRGRLPGTGQQTSSPETKLAEVRHELKSLRTQQAFLKADIEDYDKKYAATFAAAERLGKESDELRYAVNKYEQVRQRIDEKDTEPGMYLSIRPVAAAFAPAEPDNDRRLLFSLAALVAAFGFGLGAAYMRICISPQVLEAGDLPSRADSPFLGTLPRLRRPFAPNVREQALLHECVRMVRTALLQRLGGTRGSSVLVTSAGAGVGKTSFACLLAQSIAQLGKRVLLIDADLRNPSVARKLGLPNRRGLTDILHERCRDQDAIVPCGEGKLDVLLVGSEVQPGDPEILANGAFSACLDRWRKRYDMILLDSSPVMAVADARILSRHADGTIMLVREGHCRRGEVIESLACLGMAGARMLGTVFIGSGPSSGYGYQYGGYAMAPRQTTVLDVREG